ncbi:hypothetical protein FQN54_006999 [Arachnomyces sp. PD_36]|nr:hypothetical protein FQN54_006999 [Arachnomyces sp. PD_36]
MNQDYAHLSYYPNREEYTVRAAHRLECDPIDRALPEGFPQQLESKMVWDGESFFLEEHRRSDGTECVLVLDGSQLLEVDAALRSFKALKKPLGELDPSNFPLPSLHPVLRAVSDNLHKGYGFTVIRGIPVDKYDDEENMIIYVGISSHIGGVRGRQDHQFDGKPVDVMVAHITDFRQSTEDRDKYTLAAYTDGEVIFHTDVADIVSLFVLNEAATGGQSQLASSWRIYNELARTRPDLVKVLADDWVIPSANDNSVIHRRPLLFYQPPLDGNPENLIIQFSRRSFSGFGGRPQSKYLTVEQAEALDSLHFLAEKFHISMELKKGDMQFINNLSMLHARASYTDDSEHR